MTTLLGIIATVLTWPLMIRAIDWYDWKMGDKYTQYHIEAFYPFGITFKKPLIIAACSWAVFGLWVAL